MQTVLRMTNLFKEFLMNIVSLQFKRLSLTVCKGSIAWWCHCMQNDAQSTFLESLQSIDLCSGQILVPYHTTTFNN